MTTRLGSSSSVGCCIPRWRKILSNCIVTAGAIATATVFAAWTTSCAVVQTGGTQSPTVSAYRTEDVTPRELMPQPPQGPAGSLPVTDVYGDVSLPSASRLRAERNAIRALATRRGNIEQLDVVSLIAREFERYDPTYLADRASREERLDALKLKLMSSAQSGNALPCSRRRMVEAEWLLDYTAEWPKLDQKLAELERSFAIKDQGFALRQTPDGSWGACYEAWFQKINGTVDPVSLLPTLAEGRPRRWSIHSAYCGESTARRP